MPWYINFTTIVFDAINALQYSCSTKQTQLQFKIFVHPCNFNRLNNSFFKIKGAGQKYRYQRALFSSEVKRRKKKVSLVMSSFPSTNYQSTLPHSLTTNYSLWIAKMCHTSIYLIPTDRYYIKYLLPLPLYMSLFM